MPLLLPLLAACSEYELFKQDETSATISTDDVTSSSVESVSTPDYPFEGAVLACSGLTENICAYDTSLRATDPACTADVTVNRTGLDDVANDWIDRVVGGEKATVFARYYGNIPATLQHNGEVYAGTATFAELSVSLGDNRDAIADWAASTNVFAQASDFPVTHLYCYGFISTYEGGYSGSWHGNTYQIPSSDEPEDHIHAIHINVDNPWVDASPHPNHYQYHDVAPYIIDYAADEVHDANDVMLQAIRTFTGIAEDHEGPAAVMVVY
jgi:hypothetical protein